MSQAVLGKHSAHVMGLAPLRRHEAIDDQKRRCAARARVVGAAHDARRCVEQQSPLSDVCGREAGDELAASQLVRIPAMALAESSDAFLTTPLHLSDLTTTVGDTTQFASIEMVTR